MEVQKSVRGDLTGAELYGRVIPVSLEPSRYRLSHG